MSRLYACIISPNVKEDAETLLYIARQFSYSIEVLDDGILFNVSGLERLVGNADKIAHKILGQLKTSAVSGNIAVAATTETAMLLARQRKGLNHTIASSAEFQKLPLGRLDIKNDAIGIFNDLGINSIEDLRQIPTDDLINRYGQQFREVLDVIEQNGRRFLKPNIKENKVAWEYNLDFPVEDFEQLIFVVNHGLDHLFEAVSHEGHSTEHLDITFKLCRSPQVSKGVTSITEIKTYEIKTSFPTLEKKFWLKLINLRVSMDPPEAAIIVVSVVSHFTKPRPDQKSLYAASRPTPESLLLTANKLKKLVGEENVGIPVLLNQRLVEPFMLDADKLPEAGIGSGRGPHRSISEWDASSDWVFDSSNTQPQGIIAFNYFRPPLHAEVLVRDSRLVFIRTRSFSGYVTEYSGVWKANSKWWKKLWKTQEWDIEVENNGVYRLCRINSEWFLTGEYD